MTYDDRSDGSHDRPATSWYFYRGGRKNGQVTSERDANYEPSPYVVQTSTGPIPVMMARDVSLPVVTACSPRSTELRDDRRLEELSAPLS
jgi:hypothetical protein